MNCPVCGQTTGIGVVVCPTCGATLAQDTVDNPSAPPPGRVASDTSAQTRLPGTTMAGESRLSGADRSDGTGPLVPGQTFGPRYHIIRLLGIGGMGAVYQAWDDELGLSVAIKVIRPEIAADPDSAAAVERRFKRELVLARQVTHANVVRIHDLGEINDIKYITMAYVNGVDLATVLSRDGSLSVPTLLPIVRSIVSGLVAAHAAGVVHRDLKPANIMLAKDGDALIMDFGIALSSGPSATALATTVGSASVGHQAARAAVTRLGAIVGTVEYMAPEQAKGHPIDQRADVYALGLIMYDALVGRHRSRTAASAIAELQRRMEEAPPPASTVVSTVPEALDRIISRCLEPDPANRYQRSEEVAADLDRVDDNGEALPVRRVVGVRMLAAVIVAALGLLGATWRYATMAPPPPPDPVSVVIADFENRTGDPTFDGTLEPMLRRGLDDAGFITAYDRSRISQVLRVPAPEKLDEQSALELAVNQGVGVVLSGSLAREGAGGYGISVKAARAVTGEVITAATGHAANRDDVLQAATRLLAAVRSALGDDTSDSAQMFAMATLTTTSLEVVRLYADAQQAMANARFDEAMKILTRAVELDPKFGVGYQLMSVASRNLGNLQAAEKHIAEALRYLDGMTERERFSTRGMFYRVSGDYQQCVKEYGDLIARHSGDPTAHNQLALCSSKLRDMPRAIEAMRKVVQLLPKHALFRDNLALYTNYAGDFRTAEQEASKVGENDVFANLALAFARTGQGDLADAAKRYQKLGAINAQGSSIAALGLADLATYEGRFTEAAAILERAIADDLKSNRAEPAASKLMAMAHVQLLRNQKDRAVAAAEAALSHSNSVKTQFLAAKTFAETGRTERARVIAAALAAMPQPEPQSFAKIVEANVLMKTGEALQAIKVLGDAIGVLDTWIARLDLGRAYLEAGQFAQADSEFDRCLKRKGEALSLFLDEEPTYGYLPPLYYFQGRAREGLKSEGYAESYRTYLNIRGASHEDPLVLEARRRSTRSAAVGRDVLSSLLATSP